MNFKDYLKECFYGEYLGEIAYLPKSKTNINGFVKIRSKIPFHSKTIKYYRNPPFLRNKNYASILISDDPKIVKDKFKSDKKITQKEKNMLFKWIKNNKIKLDDLWENGRNWDDDKMDDFKKSLTKN